MRNKNTYDNCIRSTFRFSGSEFHSPQSGCVWTYITVVFGQAAVLWGFSHGFPFFKKSVAFQMNMYLLYYYITDFPVLQKSVCNGNKRSLKIRYFKGGFQCVENSCFGLCDGMLRCVNNRA